MAITKEFFDRLATGQPAEIKIEPAPDHKGDRGIYLNIDSIELEQMPDGRLTVRLCADGAAMVEMPTHGQLGLGDKFVMHFPGSVFKYLVTFGKPY